jgi:hypothetical protein
MLYPVPPQNAQLGDDSLVLPAAAAKCGMDSIRPSSAQRSVARTCSHLLVLGYSACTLSRAEKGYSRNDHGTRLTLGHPLTIESLGDSTLRLFEGCALRDLADFRRRSIGTFLRLLLPECDTGPS